MNLAIRDLISKGTDGQNLRMSVLIEQLIQASGLPNWGLHQDAVARMALLSGARPYNHRFILLNVHFPSERARMMVEAALLQGIMDAHPFRAEHFEELLRLFHENFSLETRAAMLERICDWGKEHQLEAFLQWLPSVTCRPDMTLAEMDEAHVFLKQLTLNSRDPRYHTYLKGFLYHHDWTVREQVARKLTSLGWQPRGRSETAAYVVARRHLKSIFHLRNKMAVALRVIFPSWELPTRWSSSRPDPRKRERFNQPDIGYLMEVMEHIPEAYDFQRVHQIYIQSGIFQEQARILLQRHSDLKQGIWWVGDRTPPWP
ncbi:hypothetical protein [Deinococcus cellulosilyticus]|uniref:Uncharacterized protein n=1 Tax=Deinococcus cellulosilyticus (strain DSM 18568 / NBRC 106333 / KACC 11606 / 5516J-15) TaxID=1223518 RepID=A0A511N1Y1_DEIC1|nr:hypothetical protein [Deinococcus cellulosilyticus]GEM46865.1 hypothetical protein DC3_25000 [Deinococcus cellulosilyticus NBRC 106333 = KACC 11606]